VTDQTKISERIEYPLPKFIVPRQGMLRVIVFHGTPEGELMGFYWLCRAMFEPKQIIQEIEDKIVLDFAKREN
jgi:hypothetical protein